MALSEEQIRRYSRQILLSSVGGVGQERLLNAPIALEGQGEALNDAAAYLSAGGTPILRATIATEPRLKLGEPFEVPGPPWREAGNLSGSRREAPTSDPLRCEAPSPDSPGHEPHSGTIAQWPDAPRGEGPWVWIRGAHVFGKSTDSCTECFEETVRAETRKLGDAAQAPSVSGVLSGALGATAALIFQRLVLGLGDSIVALSVLPSGAWAALPVVFCERHVRQIDRSKHDR